QLCAAALGFTSQLLRRSCHGVPLKSARYKLTLGSLRTNSRCVGWFPACTRKLLGKFEQRHEDDKLCCRGREWLVLAVAQDAQNKANSEWLKRRETYFQNQGFRA